MYADVESRGGILEPPGICEVKFRAADQISKMHEVRLGWVGVRKARAGARELNARTPGLF